jgi:hypothetical protein
MRQAAIYLSPTIYITYITHLASHTSPRLYEGLGYTSMAGVWRIISVRSGDGGQEALQQSSTAGQGQGPGWWRPRMFVWLKERQGQRDVTFAIMHRQCLTAASGRIGHRAMPRACISKTHSQISIRSHLQKSIVLHFPWREHFPLQDDKSPPSLSATTDQARPRHCLVLTYRHCRAPLSRIHGTCSVIPALLDTPAPIDSD